MWRQGSQTSYRNREAIPVGDVLEQDSVTPVVSE